MAGTITLLDQPWAITALGLPTSATVFFYLTGTTTLAPIFNDVALTVPATNPVVIASGQIFPDIYLNSEVVYRRRIVYGDGAIHDVDPFYAPFGSAFNTFSHSAAYPSGTVGAALNNTVNAEDAPFNAVGNGIADDTAALAAAFAYTIPRNITLVLRGSYLVSNSLYASIVATGSLNIYCDGPVTITVNAAATAFTNLIYWEGAVNPRCTVSGGSLTINLNNKCANGIGIRGNAATRSGSVNFDSPVTILNTKENNAGTVNENQALFVFGDFERVRMVQPRVDGVARVNTGGACGGISISQFTGVVELHQPYVANVLTAGTAAVPSGFDADGIKIFGKAVSGANSTRLGKCDIYGGVFVDNQGRHFKAQCSDVTLHDPKSIRQLVVTITEGSDFEFQFGNGKVLSPTFEYKLNGATTPLGTNFAPVVFQNILDDAPMKSVVRDGLLNTEVAVKTFVSTINGTTAKRATFVTENNTFEQAGAFTGSILVDAIVTASALSIKNKTEETIYELTNNRGVMSCPAFGYNSLVTADDLGTKLSLYIRNNVASKTGTVTAYSRCFTAVSGNVLIGLKEWVLNGNRGFNSVISAFTLDFRKLTPGNVFTVSLGANILTNAPAWGGSVAHVQVDNEWAGFNFPIVRVQNIVAGTLTSFFTEDGGGSWRTY